ncbi:MAG: ATP-dependent RecD-like DNA helicase [Treponema sp.]|nr:ATP-dependent RecD-like DNA helicase [Treponema sp.]
MIQNITVRVPWTDNGWCGKVCNKPCENMSCLRLKNIYENKKDEIEKVIAGCDISGHESEIPCIAEGVAFMSDKPITRMVNHPYVKSSPETHSHFRDTEQTFPPYSLPARPYLWTMKDHGFDYEKLGINFNQDLEDAVGIPFTTNWIQTAENQKEIFDAFYRNVKPKQSLCFVYAKQIPYTDTNKRVVLGIGFVEDIIPTKEYDHTDEKPARSLLWETMICHSIRPDNKNGFLIPYDKIAKYAETDPEFDIEQAIVYASDEYRWEFSFATEHLSYDGAIDTLLQTIKVLEYINGKIDGNWNECILWCKKRLEELWLDRGGYPGLGEMLCASGIRKGLFIANEINDYYKNNSKNLIEVLDIAFSKLSSFISKQLFNSIPEELINNWNGLTKERKNLFELLSRITLTEKQGWAFFYPEGRDKYKLFLKDSEIIENPYILFERTLDKREEIRIAFRKIDMAIFPAEIIQKKYPLEKPTKLDSGVDKRRIRAVLIDILEKQALNGHSLYPYWLCIDSIQNAAIEPKCDINSDILHNIEDFLKEELTIVEIESHNSDYQYQRAFQLNRLRKIDMLIMETIPKRLNKRNVVSEENWDSILDTFITKKSEDKEKEANARLEKKAVLQELLESKLSVLIGGAGTGKTTLLACFCASQQVRSGGILLLAPTGKARVRMTQSLSGKSIDFQALTVAQFLMKCGRYNPYTCNYHLSTIQATDVPQTVIIDESSMLTEEMFGALLEALNNTAKRIIFVGDPNQLPPIGTGRPFVDLVQHISENIPETKFPRVGNGFGHLKITNRQDQKTGEERLDCSLSKWFMSTVDSDCDDDVFNKIQDEKNSENIIFKKWNTVDELNTLLFDTLKEELHMDSPDDIKGFNRAFGCNEGKDGRQFFNVGCARNAEAWQILAPIRNMPYGVTNLNHIIQQKYRQEYLSIANDESTPWFRRPLPSSKGPENIVYGDKVICIKNEARDGGRYHGTKPWPEDKGQQYVANGEIGICVQWKWPQNKYVKVEYSTQPGCTYSYGKNYFSAEIDCILELAYALTIHKAQGSQFDTVILVLNEPCRLLSRELLYTATTRQVNKLIIIYNGDSYSLRNYSNPEYSDIIRRFTCLFRKPKICEKDDKYYEENLIHKTKKGDFVRSKSELIIADKLFDKGISYEYEQDFIRDGKKKIPDFTITYMGDEYIWEHCGMMSNANYKKKWEDKKIWYAEHGFIEGQNLIATYEYANSGFNSQEIDELIEKYFG